MSFKTVLWDLDGTLAYWRNQPLAITMAFVHFSSCLGAEHGFMNTALASLKGFFRMAGDRSLRSNHEVSCHSAAASLKTSSSRIEEALYGLSQSSAIRDIIKSRFVAIPEALKIVETLHARGTDQVIATSPVIPSNLNVIRTTMAGYDPCWFRMTTGSDNSSYQKSDPAFYSQLLDKLSAEADNCIMIGNDPSHDLVAEQAGIRTFLLTGRHLKRSCAPRGVTASFTGDYSVLAKLLE